MCGNRWKTAVNNRTCNCSGCPFCTKVILKDGTICDSLVDAYWYLTYKKQGVVLIYNRRYDAPQLGRSRYDFYLPKENKYIEVTSYTKDNCDWWEEYKEKIEKKRVVVENVLKASFEFIQTKMTKDKIEAINCQRR